MSSRPLALLLLLGCSSPPPDYTPTCVVNECAGADPWRCDAGLIGQSFTCDTAPSLEWNVIDYPPDAARVVGSCANRLPCATGEGCSVPALSVYGLCQ